MARVSKSITVAASRTLPALALMETAPSRLRHTYNSNATLAHLSAPSPLRPLPFLPHHLFGPAPDAPRPEISFLSGYGDPVDMEDPRDV